MHDRLHNLIEAVHSSRKKVIGTVSDLSQSQAVFKTSENTWSIVDNIEHLVWAEYGGINGIWKTLEALRLNLPHWTGPAVNKGLSIEEIVAKTWKIKEEAPEIAKPKWGGSLKFWVISLNNCQLLLNQLEIALSGMDLESIIHPHPISGPLDVLQRMEFLRFHLDRHKNQIENIMEDPAFPQSK